MDVHVLTANQVFIGFFVPIILQILKRLQITGLGWIRQNTPKVCVGVSAAIACLTTLGVHLAFDPIGHTLLISGLDPKAIVTGLLASMGGQLGSQHIFYEAVWRHFIPTPNDTGSRG